MATTIEAKSAEDLIRLVREKMENDPNLEPKTLKRNEQVVYLFLRLHKKYGLEKSISPSVIDFYWLSRLQFNKENLLEQQTWICLSRQGVEDAIMDCYVGTKPYEIEEESRSPLFYVWSDNDDNEKMKIQIFHFSGLLPAVVEELHTLQVLLAEVAEFSKELIEVSV